LFGVLSEDAKDLGFRYDEAHRASDAERHYSWAATLLDEN
jgi:hypothetical protein